MARKIKLADFFQQQGFYLTQGYGVNSKYYSQFNLLWHEGPDFGNNNKKVILRSPIKGKVILDEDDGRGNYGDNIKIWDSSQQCAIQICHLDYNKVSLGQEVNIGDELGEMGSTGNSTGEHIHFNFMITDANGNRLYRTKEQNWGYLDPQHPLDPGLPKYPPGVESYVVEWFIPEKEDMSEIIKVEKKDWERARRSMDVLNEIFKAFNLNQAYEDHITIGSSPYIERFNVEVSKLEDSKKELKLHSNIIDRLSSENIELKKQIDQLKQSPETPITGPGELPKTYNGKRVTGIIIEP